MSKNSKTDISNFKKKDIVVYPRHGAGRISKVYTENINETELKYFDIEFFNSSISISVPVHRAEELGLRYPVSKAELSKSLKNLGKRKKLNPEILADIEELTKEKLRSGNIEDAIELVNIIQSHAKKKEKENKKISFTESKSLEAAIQFISSIVEAVLGSKAVDKYILSKN